MRRVPAVAGAAGARAERLSARVLVSGLGGRLQSPEAGQGAAQPALRSHPTVSTASAPAPSGRHSTQLIDGGAVEMQMRHEGNV